MAIFKRNKHGGFADVIRCDEKDFLVWKWHPTGYDEDELVRENAIRTSSVLRVIQLLLFKSFSLVCQGACAYPKMLQCGGCHLLISSWH